LLVRLQDGFTALHMAASLGHMEIMKLLQDAGADLDAISTVRATSSHGNE
jgi:ankyrin repeat protein